MSDELAAREIATEQAFVDRVHVHLERTVGAAQRLAAEGHSRGRLGHEGGLVERDAMVFQAAKRISQLDAAREGLVFGRLDLRPEVDADPRYIGRVGLRDDDYNTLLIDWRAPGCTGGSSACSSSDPCAMPSTQPELRFRMPSASPLSAGGSGRRVSTSFLASGTCCGAK